MIFIEKLQFSDKITKILKNIKFSTERPYRLVPLLEKLCIFHCSIEELQISSKILNFSEIEEILHKITGFHENYSFHTK